MGIPLGVFLVILLISSVRGTPYGSTVIFWELLAQKVLASACIAFALAVHIKSDRFDFSGGALMTISAITAGYYCKQWGLGAGALLAGCLVLCVLGSLVTAVLYVYGRLPFIICTIGMALIFEALTNVVNDGNGVAIVTDRELNRLGKFPWELVLFLAAAVIYHLYSSYSVSGARAVLLAGGQEAAVNIGIDEKKNVFQAFMVSGALYGIASAIYVSQASPSLAAVGGTLATVGTAFSSILPVFMGFFIGSFCCDTVGIFLATLTMEFINYGIELNAASALRTAYSYICLGLFMVLFFLLSQQGKAAVRWMAQKLGRKGKTYV